MLIEYNGVCPLRRAVLNRLVANNTSKMPNVVPVRVNDETLTFRLLGKSNAHYKEFEFIGLLSEEIIFM